MNKYSDVVERQYSDYKTFSANRGFPLELTLEEFRTLIFSNCYYCNKEPQMKMLRGKQLKNGIDRKDSSKNYTTENSVSCCKVCNYSKMHKSEIEFINHINKIYLFLNKKNIK